MFANIIPENLLFVDIETVPGEQSYNKLMPHIQDLWEEKFEKFKERNPGRFTMMDDAESTYENQAALFAEFGRIVCISFGAFHQTIDGKVFKVSSFAGESEKIILTDFCDLIQKWSAKNERSLCGHNIKEFDIPFICRRMIIHGIELPQLLDISGKKPWEINYVDTLEMWKFGDFKHYTSLKLLTAVLGIPTPKDDIDGSMVGAVFYNQKDIKRIATYCQKDVIATANVLLKLKKLPVIDNERIIYAG